MNDKSEKSKADARAERLAGALRANLCRRKDQSRGQRAEETAQAAAGKAQGQSEGAKDGDV